MASIEFLGATGTVTGSKYLIRTEDKNIMIDCGLFQGFKELRERNWQSLPFPPNRLHWVVLTHAHIDHIGYLPRLVKSGYQGGVLATSATVDLCKIVLPDSAIIQEEDARYANKKGYSKHKPALPLYSLEDAERALQHLRSTSYDKCYDLTDHLAVRFQDAGHILGSSFVEVFIHEDQHSLKLLFSGDIGRYDAPILKDPTPIRDADYLVVESTYGNRLHSSDNHIAMLQDLLQRIVAQQGVLIIPAFAVGRIQEILYILRELDLAGKLPRMPIFVDSPMATSVTHLYQIHTEAHDLEMHRLEESGKHPFDWEAVHFVRNPEESKALNQLKGPAVIISASGMATGGRVLHHLTHRLPDERNVVLFVGFQAEGTRGRRLLNGEKLIKIYGEWIEVRAHIEIIDSFSAHADSTEILRWLKSCSMSPKRVFVVHGEPQASQALAVRIQNELGWKTYIPSYGEQVELSNF